MSLPNVEAPVSALRCETCPCRWGVVSPRQQVSACLGWFRARGELSVESANPLSKMGLAPGGRFGQRPWTVAETSAQGPCLAFPTASSCSLPPFRDAASKFSASLASPMLAHPFFPPPFLGPLFSLCPISCLSPPLPFCSRSPVTPLFSSSLRDWAAFPPCQLGSGSETPACRAGGELRHLYSVLSPAGLISFWRAAIAPRTPLEMG